MKNKNPITETIQRIGNAAVREAQRKNREMGIPNVYSKNGVIYYQLPDGTITMDNPLETDPKLRQRYEELRAAQQGKS